MISGFRAEFLTQMSGREDSTCARCLKFSNPASPCLMPAGTEMSLFPPWQSTQEIETTVAAALLSLPLCMVSPSDCEWQATQVALAVCNSSAERFTFSAAGYLNMYPPTL